MTVKYLFRISNICLCVYICMCVCMYPYIIYIYTYRERERLRGSQNLKYIPSKDNNLENRHRVLL